jgi:lysozyme family protein
MTEVNLMEEFKNKTISQIIGIEGGYVNDRRDSGGATKYGITERVARQCGYKLTMRELSRETAVDIYEKLYWNPLGLDSIASISEKLAHKLFDVGVNCGVSRASEWLQRSLNVFNRSGKDYPDIIVDGDVGPRTIQSLKSLYAKRGDAGAQSLYKAIKSLQGAHYLTLAERRPKDEAFVNGWFQNRV